MTQFDQTQAKPNRNHTQFTTFKLTYFFLFISSDGFIQLSLNLVKVIIIKYIHFTLIKWFHIWLEIYLKCSFTNDLRWHLVVFQTLLFCKRSSVTFCCLLKLVSFTNDLRWHFVSFSNSIVLQMIFGDILSSFQTLLFYKWSFFYKWADILLSFQTRFSAVGFYFYKATLVREFETCCFF